MADVIGRPLNDDEMIHHRNEVKTDNRPANLQVMTKVEHAIHHSSLPGLSDLSEGQVREALQGKTTDEAAHLLGVHHQTLRNRFPHLLDKRQSPHNIADPRVIALVRQAAGDDTLDIKTFARRTGISAELSKRICEANDFSWIPKSRAGEVHRTYRGKPTRRALAAGDQ